MLAFLQRRAFEEGTSSSRSAGIAGRLEIMGDAKGKPDPVVGDARAHALARMRQPPMLDVALGELAAGGADQMLARQGRDGWR